jgi:DNA-binding transcriptional LysR family regulator
MHLSSVVKKFYFSPSPYLFRYSIVPQWTDRIGRRLKPRSLHVFMVVAEQGSMGKAAQKLAMSRPVVSKTIAELERLLGVRLFDRNTHGLEATVFGRALMKRSIAVFDELQSTVRELEFLSDPNRGEVRFGCTETTAAGVAGAVIADLAEKYPGLSFQYDLGGSAVLLQQLRERKFELCLARMQSPTSDPDMECEILFRDRVFVVTGKSSPWARRRKISLGDLIDERWIVAPQELAPDAPLGEAFRREGLRSPHATALGLSIPMRNILLATGRFVTVMPAPMLQFAPQRDLLTILPVALPRWRLPMAICTMRNRTLSPAAGLFVERVRQVAQTLREER